MLVAFSSLVAQKQAATSLEPFEAQPEPRAEDDEVKALDGDEAMFERSKTLAEVRASFFFIIGRIGLFYSDQTQSAE